MNLAVFMLCLVGFLVAFCPFCLLVKIIWQDWSLPADHIDYRNAWGGKKLPYVCALILGAVAGGMAWMGYYFLMA